MKVEATINNLPNEISYPYIVVRRSETDAKLWYYGNYSSEKQAQKVAIEIGNGLVLRKGGF